MIKHLSAGGKDKIPKSGPIWNKRMIELMREAIMKGEFNTEGEWFRAVGYPQNNKDRLIKGPGSFMIRHIIKAAKLHNTTTDFILGLTDIKHDVGKKMSAEQLIEEGLRVLRERK